MTDELVPDRHRVTKTSEALYSPPRTLRKRRRCGGHLSEPHWIEVGDEWWITYHGANSPPNVAIPKDTTWGIGLANIRAPSDPLRALRHP